jgi:chromosome segregation ATPase
VYEYLETQDIGSLDYRLSQLKTEPQENQAIISALSEQRAALVKLQDQLNRFYTQNEQLVASLGTINSQLVNMSVAGDEADERQLVDHVRDLHDQVDAMSDGLREAYGKTDAPALPG